MEKLGLNEIREKFLSFYESKGHLRLPSFPLIPQNDKSLLLINAGMAPLKPYFTGQETPPRKRVTTCQKCIRTPDIERVGKTARHGTYFEMLGNFSFGDYFKREATAWAWEFATQVLELPVDKLWVTIYLDDDEAFDIWTKEVGVAPERIVRMGKEDNFWEIGQGPCGPCSELYFDRGEEAGCGSPDCGVGCECDRFVEFWNLVFTQFDKDEDGNYNRLANPNIDTGMGLERIACIMQGVNNLFEVDTVRNIMKKICSIAGVEYGADPKTDISLRVITDHIRSTSFMIADGVQVSNEGRGYVLRRLLRRAARHGKLLGLTDPFLYQVVDTVVEENKGAYPELVDKADYIKKIVEMEETRFAQTIGDGLSILNNLVEALKAEGKTVLAGEEAFKLYDTYGFPIDLTDEILEEQGLTADHEAFDKCMNEQRERARAGRGDGDTLGWKDDSIRKLYEMFEPVFVGYNTLTTEARIMAIVYDMALQDCANADNGNIMVVLDKTPFYGESGGQTGDHGRMETKTATLEVLDTMKVDGKIVHVCTVVSGGITVGDTVVCTVDREERRATEKNHSATHLLQKALRTVLGSHVEQAGSYVSDERLRFDFSHYEAVTPEQLAEVEKMVNEAIAEGYPVSCTEMSMDEAKKLGAMALFGEKYGDLVRVVQMGDFSVELCGGTHVTNTASIGLFKILSESSVAAGVRRIEAITGGNILKYLEEKESLLNKAASALKTAPQEICARIESLQADNKALEHTIADIKQKIAGSGIEDAKKNMEEIAGIKIFRGAFVDMDVDTLRKAADNIKSEFDSVIAVMAAYTNDRVNLMVTCSKDAVGKGIHCGNIIKAIAPMVGGNGGGRPDSAQAGGKDPKGVDEALLAAYDVIKQQLGE
ncbi:MAG: alanine--tRNA ligase [Ruminococcaceae bacterium]|nr:alanine--tRNA ligase [Oscillospiraceae bacterium]